MDMQRQRFAKDKIARFAAQFGEPHRRLARFAALPLIITPELLNYLHQHFLRGAVPWEAAADLLLSELCQPVGYEQFALDPAVRDCLIHELREQDGEYLESVARLLIRHVRQLSRQPGVFSPETLQAEQWSAMLFLTEKSQEAAAGIAHAIGGQLQALAGHPDHLAQTVGTAELERLLRVTQVLAAGLGEYPALLDYAQTIGRLLESGNGRLNLQANTGTVNVAGVVLPDLTEMVWLPGGTFLMGSPERVGNDNEHPQHWVRLDPYAIGKYPVTVGEFRQFVEATGYRTDAERKGGAEIWDTKIAQWQHEYNANWRNSFLKQNDRHPVVCVSWNDALAYCRWLSEQTGQAYSLLTEAQWENACRAGNNALYCFGDDEGQLGDFAWHGKNSGNNTHSVGEKQANLWGIHDMYGNVWEWCQDWYAEDYYRRLVVATNTEVGRNKVVPRPIPATGDSPETPASGLISAYQSFTVGLEGQRKVGQLDPTDEPAFEKASQTTMLQDVIENPAGPNDDSHHRVVRGGSWINVAKKCRSAHRKGNKPSTRNNRLGFRLARTGSWHSHPFTLCSDDVGRQPFAAESAIPTSKDVGMGMPTYEPGALHSYPFGLDNVESDSSGHSDSSPQPDSIDEIEQQANQPEKPAQAENLHYIHWDGNINVTELPELHYKLDFNTDAKTGEFYLNHIGEGSQSKNEFSRRWLEADICVTRREGSVLNVGMMVEYRVDDKIQQMYCLGRETALNQWKTGFTIAQSGGTAWTGGHYSHEQQVLSFAFFIDIEHTDGRVLRLWDSNQSRNYSMEEVFSKLGHTQSLGIGSIRYADENSPIFANKQACREYWGQFDRQAIAPDTVLTQTDADKATLQLTQAILTPSTSVRGWYGVVFEIDTQDLPEDHIVYVRWDNPELIRGQLLQRSLVPASTRKRWRVVLDNIGYGLDKFSLDHGLPDASASIVAGHCLYGLKSPYKYQNYKNIHAKETNNPVNYWSSRTQAFLDWKLSQPVRLVWAEVIPSSYQFGVWESVRFFIEVENMAYHKRVFIQGVGYDAVWNAEYFCPVSNNREIWFYEHKAAYGNSLGKYPDYQFIIGYAVADQTYWDDNGGSGYILNPSYSYAPVQSPGVE